MVFNLYLVLRRQCSNSFVTNGSILFGALGSGVLLAKRDAPSFIIEAI